MYSWDDSLEDWALPGAYKFDSAGSERRKSEARKAESAGPRAYHKRSGPQWKLVDPNRVRTTASRTPVVVAVDVTGSMRRWPFEIFDRLPLLYNTLSQYRQDLEVLFVAIGDARCDQWPLQVTEFAKGYALEQQLKALYGEGGGGDEPESYGLFAYWLNRQLKLENKPDEKPFLIVFGDASMHKQVTREEIESVLPEQGGQGCSAQNEWREVSKNWNTWFLRRKGTPGDAIDKQWSSALGHQQILHIEDEPRAVDMAMGLIARHWGCISDFKSNMAARQAKSAVQKLLQCVERAMSWRDSRAS
ncbi:hypothetical protein IV102_00995 [bacterium]|nr:hypothetical protein [bacterium]